MHNLSMNVHRLLQLLQVVESGSINKAAHALNISQPALTRSIRTLERSLGTLLLDRSVKGVVPTPQGSLLVASARAIRASLNQTIGNLEVLSGNKVLRIGATSGVCWLVTQGIEQLQKIYPACALRAVEAHTGNLLAQLTLGELDLVLCPSVSEPLPSIESEPVFSQDYCIWVRSTHHLTRQKNLSLAGLANETWMIPQRESGLRLHLDATLRKASVKLTGPVIECSSHMIARELLVNHDRLALLARMTFDIERRAGLLTPLEGRWSFPFQSYTCYLRKGERTNELQHLLKLIKSAAKAANIKPTRAPRPGR